MASSMHGPPALAATRAGHPAAGAARASLSETRRTRVRAGPAARLLEREPLAADVSSACACSGARQRQARVDRQVLGRRGRRQRERGGDQQREGAAHVRTCSASSGSRASGCPCPRCRGSSSRSGSARLHACGIRTTRGGAEAALDDLALLLALGLAPDRLGLGARRQRGRLLARLADVEQRRGGQLDVLRRPVGLDDADHVAAHEAEAQRGAREDVDRASTPLRSPNSGASTRTWWLRSNSRSKAKRPSTPLVAVATFRNAPRKG